MHWWNWQPGDFGVTVPLHIVLSKITNVLASKCTYTKVSKQRTQHSFKVSNDKPNLKIANMFIGLKWLMCVL